MKSNRILLLELPVNLDIISRLDPKGNLMIHPEQGEYLNDEIDAIFTKLRNKLDQDFLSRFKNLRAVITPTTGLDHIDRDYCKMNGVEITSLRDLPRVTKSITSTTELIWWHLIELVRKPSLASAGVREAKWNREEIKSNSLKDLTIGIIGFGRIGKQVFRLAEAMRMNILINDKILMDSKKYSKHFVDIEDIFERCNIVILSITESPENQGFINSELLQKIGPDGLYLINCSRGQLVVEVDILEALGKKQLLGYGADVLENERNDGSTWIESNPIWKAFKKNEFNITLTPHIGGATLDSISFAEKAVFEEYFRKNKKRLL